MRARSLGMAVVGLIGALSLGACGATDSVAPAKPAAAAPTLPASHSLILSGSRTVTPVLRTTPLAAPISVSKNIGVLGGVIAIPQAGVTVVVPPLALSSTKTIKITAQAGSNIAYEFEPHGTTFNLPLVLTQNLLGTQAAPGGLVNALSLYGGYFPNSSAPTTVTELLPIGVTLQPAIAVMAIWHFSGYIVATGRDSDSDF